MSSWVSDDAFWSFQCLFKKAVQVPFLKLHNVLVFRIWWQNLGIQCGISEEVPDFFMGW